MALRRSFEKEDFLVRMNKQEKKHFEAYNFVYFLNTLKQEQTLPKYHSKFKTVSDGAYYNVARRRNDILNGLQVLTLRDTKLDNISTIYHYIQTYDRFKDLIDDFGTLDKPLVRA
jgi:hypothetical protein